jgi:hypothetical protein
VIDFLLTNTNPAQIAVIADTHLELQYFHRVLASKTGRRVGPIKNMRQSCKNGPTIDVGLLSLFPKQTLIKNIAGHSG